LSNLKEKPENVTYSDENGNDADYDVLTEEGQEGWMEKLLKKVRNLKLVFFFQCCVNLL
jgi:hypothetical protein